MTKFLEKFRKVGIFALILGILWQTTSLSTVLNIGHAKACETIKLNEFVSISETEWVEIYNTSTTETIDLNGWKLTDLTSPDSTPVEHDLATLSGTIGPKSAKAFDVSGLNDSGDSIRLYENTTKKDQVTYGTVVGYTSNVSAPTTDLSAARIPDGTGTWTTNQTPTKGLRNSPDITAPTIAITEPENGAYYNAKTIPSQITGTVADNTSGDGLDANSTKFYLKNSDGKYWTGSNWENPTISWLSTKHDYTTDSAPKTWISNADMPTWKDGVYTVKVKATDREDNVSYSETTFTYDNTAPTGSIVINDGEKVTSSQNIQIKLPATEEFKTGLEMKVTGDFKQVKTENNGWQKHDPELTNQTLTNGNGKKILSVQFRDKAGNESEIYTTSIYYNKDAKNIDQQDFKDESNKTGIKTAEFQAGNLLIDMTAEYNRITSYTTATYNSLPEGSHGFQFFGTYFDITFEDDSAIKWPIKLEIKYTKSDLEAAGITEEQITGLYFYNSATSTWDTYSDQTIDTENFIEKGVEYEGKVIVSADHLTPMVLGADTEAPVIPDEFKAEAKDGSVKLTWNNVDDADHYDVRYRKSTDDNDAVAYSEIYIINDTETEISGLENGVEYEFNIRAVDAADNKGEWAVVVATPNPSDEELARRAELAKQVAYYGSVASSTTNGSSQVSDDENKDDETEIVTEGEVKSEDDVEGETEGARTAVTLGIIIIAIGAALGGYYGYQWWLGEGEMEEEALPKKETKTTQKPKSKKKKKSNRRW